MSRSGYSDSCEGWDLIRWRGAVTSSLRGERGQAFLRELIVSLDAMPQKVLIAESLVEEGGAVCAMGSVAIKRGLDMRAIDPDDRDSVADAFGISPAMAAEIAFLNDEGEWRETPEHRWKRMREWAERQVRP